MRHPDGGIAVCWGDNSYGGQLGDGTETNSNTPVNVYGLTNITALAAGNAGTCAIITGNTARCWGFGSVGQNGDGTRTTRLTPVPVLTD